MIIKKLNTEKKKWLMDHFGEYVRFEEPMSRHTSFRVGGPAEAYVIPQNIESLAGLVTWAGKTGILLHVIGGGTNLLVKDEGISGIVVSLGGCFNKISIDREDDDKVIVSAMAGAGMKSLCKFAIKNRLEGMKFAFGIPGTIGGSIMMNAGTAYGAISDILASVSILTRDGEIKTLKRESLDFKYRKLYWNTASPIILKGEFFLFKSSRSIEEMEQEARAVLEKRRKNQPLGFPSAGCFFKNPPSGEPAGKLIEMAGLKGVCAGGAQVSSIHANFIINIKQAACSDILELADMIKKKVAEMFGVELEAEVRFFE